MNKYSTNVAWSEEDGAFVATSSEFPGLSGLGATDLAAISELHKAMDLALAEFAREGDAPPDPLVLSEYSGQLRLRLPRSLHGALADRAARDGVSLNTLIVSAISFSLGCERGALDSARAQREELRQLFEASRRDIALLVSDASTATAAWMEPSGKGSAIAYGSSIDSSTQSLLQSVH